MCSLRQRADTMKEVWIEFGGNGYSNLRIEYVPDSVDVQPVHEFDPLSGEYYIVSVHEEGD